MRKRITASRQASSLSEARETVNWKVQ